MKRRLPSPSLPPGSDPRLLLPPTGDGKITIVEAAPDAKVMLEQLAKDPAKLPGTIRQLAKLAERGLERKKNRQKGAEEARDKKAQKKNTQQKKERVFEIVDRLERELPRLRLPRTTNQKVTAVLRRWKEGGDRKPPGRRILHDWIKSRRSAER